MLTCCDDVLSYPHINPNEEATMTTNPTTRSRARHPLIGKRVSEGKRTGVVVRVSKDGVYALLLLDSGYFWYVSAADMVELAS